MNTSSAFENDSTATLRRPLTSDWWTVLAVVGSLLAGAGIASTGRTSSVILAAVALGIAVGFVTPIALAGCLLIVGIVEPTSILSLSSVGAGLFVLAVAGLGSSDSPLTGIATLSIVTAALVGIGGVAWTLWPPWLAVTAVLTVIAIGGYATHRYERVMLGLVTDGDDLEAEQ